MEPRHVFHLARNLKDMVSQLHGLEASKAELLEVLAEADDVAQTLRSQIEESKRLLAEFSRLTALK